MHAVRRKELEALLREQKVAVQELQREGRRAARRARDHLGPARISSGKWVLLRVAETLAAAEAEAVLVATHVWKHRCGKRAHPGGGPKPPKPPALAGPAVERAAAEHLGGDIQSRVARRAAMLVAEARVVHRINDANTKGASPSVVKLAEWLVFPWPLAERRGRYADFVAKLGGRGYRKSWAVRFRTRWHIRMRITHWRAAEVPEMQRRKAFFFAPAGPIFRPFLGPIFGAEKRPHFWGHFLFR